MLRRTAHVLLLSLVAACVTHPNPMPSNARLVHDVYFTLQDSSPAACQELVDACYDRLSGIDGIVGFVAGTREAELTRDVNDQDYHVSLHVWFDSRASHDAYQDAAPHLQFIEENKGNWSGVRVFDSAIAAR